TAVGLAVAAACGFLTAVGFLMGWGFVLRSAAADPRALLRLEKTEEAMGSTFAVVLYGGDRTRLEAAAAAAFDEVQRLDRMLSNYQPDSEWSRINRDAGLRAVTVSPELFHLLSQCVQYSRQS